MTASATAKDPEAPGGLRPPPQPLLHVLDSNHNGELNKDEIANASSALIALDKNDDGELTRKELLPPPPKKGDKKLPPLTNKRPPLLIAVIDFDKDGILSADEIKNAPESLLVLDKNEDGVISKKELHPGKPTVKDPT